MTNLDIAHQRLNNQRITGGTFERPEEVVLWLGAVQSQDFAGAKWALGLRMQRAADSIVEKAFNEGDILRTHVMRPTWHFVTPADIRWMLALTAPRVHAVNASMYRRLELDQAIFSRSNAAIIKALQGGKQLTREELREVLQQAGITAEGVLQLAYLVMRAELDGIICSGPRRGKQFTYMLLDERAPHARTLERDEALAEFAQRYFVSRGPATVQDFAKWSGLTIADAGRGLEAVKAQLRQDVVDGQAYWLSTSALPVKDISPTAHLLSIYDEYVSGYKDRSAIGDKWVSAKLFALGNALAYIIVVDGRIVGSWRRTLQKSAVVIKMNIFTPLTEAEKQAVALAAQQYGAFLGLSVVME
jgi:hypothetical protein